MVRHHLLLPDVATRRDLDDPATIEAVAEAVGDLRTLGCSPPSPRPTRSPPARRPGARGRPSSSATSSPAPPTCSAAARADEVARRLPHRRAPRRCCARARSVLDGDGDRLTVVAARPPGPVQPGRRRAGAARPRRARRRRSPATTAWPSRCFRVESQLRADHRAGTGSIADLEQALDGRLALAGPARRAGPRLRRPRRRARRCTSRRAWSSTTTRLARRHRGRGARAPTRSACSTASPAPWPSSTSTSVSAKVQTLGDRGRRRLLRARRATAHKVTDPDVPRRDRAGAPPRARRPSRIERRRSVGR